MQDLRHAFMGLAIATVAGLLLGAAFKPALRDTGDLEGPQMLAGVSGARSTPSQPQSASWTSYGDRIPDYVIGADWVQQDAPLQMAESEPEPDPAPPRIIHEPPPRVAPARYETAAAPTPSYPSMGGDILAGLAESRPATQPDKVAPEPPPA